MFPCIIKEILCDFPAGLAAARPAFYVEMERHGLWKL